MTINHLNRSGGCHRRSVSCLTTNDEFTYLPIEVVEEEDDATISTDETVSTTRQTSRATDGVSMAQLQRSLKAASTDDVAAGSFGGKIKLSPGSPGPRRSLLSDMINSSQNNQMERNAHRRRVLKSMRRYSVDASEMNIDVLGRATPLKGIPSEGGEATTAANGTPEFKDTPTVRYLRNPSYATVKTKLISSAVCRGAGGDGETTDYFGTEDRVW